MHRTIDGKILVQHLTEDERLIDRTLLVKHGRTSRTLVKEGPLRLAIVALAAGGDLPQHRTEGPVTIQLLEGAVVFEALGHTYSLSVGDSLVFAPGVAHSARSVSGGLFLLTVVHTPSAGSREDFYPIASDQNG
jgi:quercetin dioxygenase-like cupin family protein